MTTPQYTLARITRPGETIDWLKEPEWGIFNHKTKRLLEVPAPSRSIYGMLRGVLARNTGMPHNAHGPAESFLYHPLTILAMEQRLGGSPVHVGIYGTLDITWAQLHMSEEAQELKRQTLGMVRSCDRALAHAKDTVLECRLRVALSDLESIAQEAAARAEELHLTSCILEVPMAQRAPNAPQS